MDCEAARLALIIARRGRDDAKLRELQELQDARNKRGINLLGSSDSVSLVQAQTDVELWNARCDDAEIALAECLEKRQMKQLHPRFNGSRIRAGGTNT